MFIGEDSLSSESSNLTLVSDLSYAKEKTECEILSRLKSDYQYNQIEKNTLDKHVESNANNLVEQFLVYQSKHYTDKLRVYRVSLLSFLIIFKFRSKSSIK